MSPYKAGFNPNNLKIVGYKGDPNASDPIAVYTDSKGVMHLRTLRVQDGVFAPARDGFSFRAANLQGLVENLQAYSDVMVQTENEGNEELNKAA